MKGITKSILIILTFFGFIIMGVLLITKMGDVSKLGAAITYDANGCPKDGKTWTYHPITGNCTATVSPTYTCADGYKWSIDLNKCYKAATRTASDYQCFNGDSKTTNNRYLGTGTYCLRNKDKKVCSSGGVDSSGNCVITQKAQKKVQQYTITYNANGGYKVNNGKKVNVYSEKVTYGESYTVKNIMFKKDGYTFVGWNEKKDGSGIKWTKSNTKNWKWNYKKNVTLYAQWKKVGSSSDVSTTSFIKNSNLSKCAVTSYNKQEGTDYNVNIKLSKSALAKLKTLSCDSYVTDISGVEYMTNLTKLDLHDVGIGKANLKSNTKLTYLNLGTTYENYYSSLSSLDLSKNTGLTTLKLGGMTIKNGLDVRKLTKLSTLELYDVNLGRNLNLTKNTNLQYLTINNALSIMEYKALNLTKNTKLKFLSLEGIKGVPILNLTKNTNLKTIKTKDVINMNLQLNGKYTTSELFGYKTYTKQ